MRKLLLLLGFLMSISLAQTASAAADGSTWELGISNKSTDYAWYPITYDAASDLYSSDYVTIPNGYNVKIKQTNGSTVKYWCQWNGKIAKSNDSSNKIDSWTAYTSNYATWDIHWDDEESEVKLLFSYNGTTVTGIYVECKTDDEPNPPVIEDPEKETVATPEISQEGNKVAITCATDGAVIYYAIDNQSITPPQHPLFHSIRNY